MIDPLGSERHAMLPFATAAPPRHAIRSHHGTTIARMVRKVHLRLWKPFQRSTRPLFLPSMSSRGTFPAAPGAMIFFLLSSIFSLVLDVIRVRRQTDHDKDVEIILLRQQLRILHRNQHRPPRISRWQKLALLVLASKLTTMSSKTHARLSQVIVLVKPDTLLKWHRELVRRKWTFIKKTPLGRQPLSPELVTLILGLAKENPTWGYGTLEGELGTLRYDIGRSTICDVLKRRHIPPAPERGSRAATGARFSRTTKASSWPATSYRSKPHG